MTIYMDITQLEKGRANTGIQRVVKEFLQRVVEHESISLHVLSYNSKISQTQLLDNQELRLFLKDIQNYQFKKLKTIDITTIKASDITIFFDMDAVWNSPLKRDELYPLLKENGFLIFNFIYDLIPLLMPQFAHEFTVKNFTPYIETLYKHSDFVFFDSHSAQDDFFSLKQKLNIDKEFSTKVVPLGSDFTRFSISKSQEYEEILNSKYILFVGTLEPRKKQQRVLEAFELLAKEHEDLNLVFIGKQGWKIDAFAKRLNTHPLKDKRLFWLQDIDDSTLNNFYEKAFIVTYLSNYEGYGLPIAESLKFSNITIASKNSSMYEAGQNYADYVLYDSAAEIADIISLYCVDKELYEKKREFIKEGYKATSWSDMYNSIGLAFENYQNSLNFKKEHLSKLQFVFISIDYENIQGTIEAIDKHAEFVKEYLVITAPKNLQEFKELKSKHPISIIDEREILGEYAKDFHTKDHQSKNWLLRASLLNIASLEDEFIMLDDDNRPIKEIDRSYFISQSGKYNAYYFYSLLEWNAHESEYDKGQHNTLNVLKSKNLELLSYSSHAPQIINKKIFKEAVDEFFDIGLKSPIDEWSIYFNYANSNYPHLFNKKLFQTLSWPALLSDWDYMYVPKEFSFENYYKHLYEQNILSESMTPEQKIALRQKDIEELKHAQAVFDSNRAYISKNNLVYGAMSFKDEDSSVLISGIPKEIRVSKQSLLRIKPNYKVLNCKDKNVTVVVSNHKNEILSITISPSSNYEEDVLELPINSSWFYKQTKVLLNIHVSIDGMPLSQSYPLTLHITDKKREYRVQREEVQKETKSLKQIVKSIPFMGWFFRWSYNLLRLNNIKHSLFMLEQHVVHSQQAQLEWQQSQLERQQIRLEQMQAKIDELTQEKDNFTSIVEQAVSREMLFESQGLQQRLDQFIFDAKIELKNKSL